jgi:mutator protein MutT
MRSRAGIILIENNELALIERHRSGSHYFSFPGGGIDKGETPEQAAVREAEEELGILVEIQQKAVEVFINGNIQHYFLAKRINGEFGTGTGEEYGEYHPAYGTYLPLWMAMGDVMNNNVLPRGLAERVVQCAETGWPQTPIKIIEEIK